MSEIFFFIFAICEPLNQINCDKDYFLNNRPNILRFYAFGSYLEIKRHFKADWRLQLPDATVVPQ